MRLDKYNWLGNIKCFEGVLQKPTNEQQVIDILQDPVLYPGPIRPMGSRHSMTACMAANGPQHWGTAVDMTGLRTVRNGDDIQIDEAAQTATIPAGRTFIEVAK